MKLFKILLSVLFSVLFTANAFAAEKWDMALAYGASNFHSANAAEFAKNVSEKSGGKLTIVTHPGGSLFKGGEIFRAVRTGQAQIGERFMSALGKEDPLLEIDSQPFLATSYDDAMKLYQASKPAIVTVLHAFNYGTIDLVLVFVLILGSIIGVQFGQKIGEKVDSSEFKTILAVLLLLVGIAIAYDTFIKDDVVVETVVNGTKNLGNIAQFILDYSKDLPVFYGLTSVVLAVVLGIGAAILRNYISKWNKAREAKLKA